MLPSRGAVRLLSSGRTRLSASNVARTSGVTDGLGRQFGTSSRLGGSPWSARSALRPGKVEGAAGIAVSGSAISARRALSFWSRGPSKTETDSAAAATTPDQSAAAAAAPPASSTSSSAAEALSPPSTSTAATPDLSNSFPPTPSGTSLDVPTGNLADVPEQIGYLNSLGLDFGWGPSSMMQWLLEHIYIYTGLPWWAAIPVTVLATRVILFKPSLKAQLSSAKMQKLSADPDYEAMKAKMQSAMASKDQVAMQEARQTMSFMHKREGVSPFGAMWGFLQIPVGYGLFIVLNNMAKIPVPSLETGGLLWFQDLSVSDPFFVLPAIGSLSLIGMISMGMKNVPAQSQAQMKLLMYIMAPLTFFVSLWLPAVVQWYFIMSGIIGYGQNALFLNPAFRRTAGLPPLPNKQKQQQPLPESTKHISGAMYYPPTSHGSSNTIPTTATTTSGESAKAGEDEGAVKGTMSKLRQTLYDAKGGMGNYVDAAKKEQADKNAQAWNDKRAEEDRRRLKADLKRKR